MQVSSPAEGVESLLTVTESAAVHGCGVLEGGLVENHGLVLADEHNKAFSLMTGRLNNHSRAEAVNGSTLRIMTHLVGTEGSVVSAVTGTVLVAGELFHEAIITGVMRTEGTGLTFTFSWHNHIRGAVINGPCRMVTAGMVHVKETTLNGPFSLDGDSRIVIWDTPGVPATLTVGEPGSVRGEGSIVHGIIENHGAIIADATGKTLSVECLIKNRGSLRAQHGGTLLLKLRVEGFEGSVISGTQEGVVLSHKCLIEGVMGTVGTGITFSAALGSKLYRATVYGPISFRADGKVDIADTTLNGPANMDGPDCTMTLWPETDDAALLKLGPHGRIRGCGVVQYGRLENRGIISADMSDQTLRVECDLQNQGRLEAAGGGTLLLQGITTGKPRSVIVADRLSTVLLMGAFTGETETQGSGLTISNNGNNKIVDATINGPVTMPEPSYVEIARTTLNGVAEFRGDNARMDIVINNGASTLTFGAAGGARGCGSIYGSMGGNSDVENHRTVTADVGGKTLNMVGVRMTNNHQTGTLEVKPGATLHLRGATNRGTFRVEQNGVAIVGAVTQYEGLTNVNGTLNIHPDGQFVLAGGALTGSGTINGRVVNQGGTLDAGNSPGVLRITGDYEQTTEGVLDIELNGPKPFSGHDQLQVTGLARLGGKLRIIPGEFQPEEGSVYTIITHGSRAGEFGEVLSAHRDYSFEVVYNPDSVQVVAHGAGWRLPKG